MREGIELSPQDQERQARTIATLRAESDVIKDTLAAKDPPAHDGREQHAEPYAEAQRIRREIVERLETLHAQRLAAGGSGAAE